MVILQYSLSLCIKFTIVVLFKNAKTIVKQYIILNYML
jgi:hypothetical protein